jgi:DNA topoisomerase VI subunit B
MKIQTIKTDVKKSQEFETVNYGVSTDNLPLLFQMLRTNLYSDIYGSIIREIASNVMDSHIEAGKPDAVGEIEWIDENRLLGVDAQLIIRDFGVGLSPERMKTVYGNYLSSTKRDSNDQTGGFGLGSKVPFAYTDSFFVKTVFEGTEYKYLCYIDETQLGAISLLEKKETTRQNGTEIIVPAKKQYDKSTFQHSIFAQLTYFKNFNFNSRFIFKTF